MQLIAPFLLLMVAAYPLAGQVLVNGAGATFPYPIYAKWFDRYHELHPEAQINYQSIGSGGGIRQLQAGTVDFGASDCPMTDEQMQQSSIRVLHFPTVLGAVVPAYNIPGVVQELRFTPGAIAGILLGTIRKWNAPPIADANPGVKLPAADIVVVHRSDGSGTTFVWTDYLSKVSTEWKAKVGSGTAVSWPTGLGAKGNEGVAGLVKQTPNSFGYLELVYAMQNKIAYGSVRNAAMKYVKADLVSVTAAANSSVPSMADSFRVSITNPAAPDAYPISSFTWLLIPENIPDPKRRQALTGFLRWMLDAGQDMAAHLGYAPLPKALIARERKTLAGIH